MVFIVYKKSVPDYWISFYKQQLRYSLRWAAQQKFNCTKSGRSFIIYLRSIC